MTSRPRLFDDLKVEAARLDRLASGYRLADERRLARAALRAADSVRDTMAALAVLSAMKGEDD